MKTQLLHLPKRKFTPTSNLVIRWLLYVVFAPLIAFQAKGADLNYDMSSTSCTEFGGSCPVCPTSSPACTSNCGGSPTGPNSSAIAGTPPAPGGNCPPGASEGDSCHSAIGLATWSVSEPAINVLLKDVPLLYKASRGHTIQFQLFYKNRNGTSGTNDNAQASIFSFGKRWYSPWRSYIEGIASEPTNFWIFPGEGVAAKFTLDQPEYRSRAKLTQISSTNVLQFPDGAVWRYGLSFTNAGVVRYFLTQMDDEHGNGLSFSYIATNGSIKLNQILDVDQRATTFEYVTAGGYSNLVTKIIAPHGRTNLLQYDSQGQLTNITDSVGLTSRMTYDATNLTALTTPYGTTTFNYFDSGNQMSAVRVTEMGLRNYFFLYRDEVEGGKVPSSYTAYLPATTNGSFFAVANSFDNENSHQRNSFNWGPRQFETISDNVRTNLMAGTFSVSNLTSGDYLKGRISHWLKSGTNVGITRSFRRDASPDGSTQGQISWYDHAGKIGGARDQEGTNSKPQMTATKLPNGECRFNYTQRNALGHPTLTAETYTTPAGYCQVRTNQFEYAGNQIDLIRQVQLADAGTKQVFSNVFNSTHRVIASYNALGEVTTHTYNDKQQRTSTRRPGGLITTNVYETSGTWSNFMTARIKSAIGATNWLTYSNGHVFTTTDERGLTRIKVRDELGRKTAIYYPDGTSKKRRFENLHVVETVDRLNATNRYGFNAFRQKIQKIDERGATNSYSYCACGTLESMTDGVGLTTQYVYDQKRRLCATLHPGGYSVTNNYDLMGRVTNTIDSFGVSLTNYFNNQGMVCDVLGAAGARRRTIFDSEDQQVQSVDANSITNFYVYDDLGRRLAETNGIGAVTTFAYSELGLIAQTDPMSNSTFYAYDAARRKIAETNANGEVTQFRYDARGNLTNLIDGRGQSTWWGYDQYGRVTNKTDAAGNVIFLYSYDAKGRLTNRWTPAKGNTAYRYDASGNLTNVIYATSPSISYQYDANNRLVRMVDAIGTTAYAYSSSGDLLSEDGPWANDAVSYLYTSNRLRSRMTLQQLNASSWVQDYTYDASARLSSISSPAGTFNYTYDPLRNQQVRRVSLPNGSYITNAYDELGRMLSTVLKKSDGTTLNLHSYVYDDASRRTRQTRTAGDYVNYDYDRVGQVTAAVGKESGGSPIRLLEQMGYTYDAAGNLNRRTNNSLVQSFTVNALNQLSNAARSGTLTVVGTTTSEATDVTVNSLTAERYGDNTFAKDGFSLVSGTNTFTAVAHDSSGRSDSRSISAYLPTTNSFLYDLNGNLLTDGSRHFSYDDENQMTTVVVTNTTKSVFLYDGFMRRRVRKEYVWQSGFWQLQSVIHYVFDGNLVLQERNENNVALITLTRGNDLSGKREGAGGNGGLLARTDAMQPNSLYHVYFHGDAGGNISLLVGSTQSVVAKYIYSSFGHVLAETGPLADANLYRFSSKEFHTPSGLTYYLYRFYDPSFQRWINRDPILERDDVNLYRFVRNSPIGNIDAFGLKLNVPVADRDDAWVVECMLFCDKICASAPAPQECLKKCYDDCMNHKIPTVACLLKTPK